MFIDHFCNTIDHIGGETPIFRSFYDDNLLEVPGFMDNFPDFGNCVDGVFVFRCVRIDVKCRLVCLFIFF